MYNVAIVEDQSYVANAIATMIEHNFKNFHVSGIYRNGRDFLHGADDKVWPDIVLSDIEMPFVNGLELAEYIHERKLNSKVILLTGHKNFDYLKEGMRNEISDYLLKPCLQTELLHALEGAAGKLTLNEFQSNISSEEKSITETKMDDMINLVLKYIEEHYNKDITLNDVAEKFYISYNYLSSVFSRQIGNNFSDYLADIRINKSKEYLGRYDLKISQVALMVGYSNYRYFNFVFKRKVGCTPSEYRKMNCFL